MVGREGAEGGAENGVVAGGVDDELVGERSSLAVDKVEAQAQTLGTANPVALHQPDLFGPAGQAVEGIEKLARIVGDLEKPLGRNSRFSTSARTPAAALDDLLIGGTVRSTGSQLTKAVRRSTRPAAMKSTNIACSCR